MNFSFDKIKNCNSLNIIIPDLYNYIFNFIIIKKNKVHLCAKKMSPVAKKNGTPSEKVTHII